jgi:hypothetical protein
MGCGLQWSMKTFCDSELYGESNGATFVIAQILVPEISRIGLKVKKGCGQKISMTSFSESKFYVESNGGSFVTRLPLVPEISRLGLGVKKGVWPTLVSEVIIRLRILRRIEWCYFCDSVSSGSGDIEDRIKGQKGVWPKNFDEVIF